MYSFPPSRTQPRGRTHSDLTLRTRRFYTLSTEEKASVADWHLRAPAHSVVGRVFAPVSDKAAIRTDDDWGIAFPKSEIGEAKWWGNVIKRLLHTLQSPWPHISLYVHTSLTAKLPSNSTWDDSNTSGCTNTSKGMSSLPILNYFFIVIYETAAHHCVILLLEIFDIFVADHIDNFFFAIYCKESMTFTKIQILSRYFLEAIIFVPVLRHVIK